MGLGKIFGAPSPAEAALSQSESAAQAARVPISGSTSRRPSTLLVTPSPTTSPTVEASTTQTSLLSPDNGAADIVNVAVNVDGTSVFDLCAEGDKLIEEGTAAVYNKSVKGGLALPTSISVNNCVAHFSPLSSDPLSSQKLAKGEMVKLHLGAYINDFAAIAAETIVVGVTPESSMTGRRVDAL
ncbi:hypothetical protein F5148DRAFT_1379196 [Russula earlei]|uniref:Uncharacterized protein n=1 Tax=Russula earlei TaxID=71964 RepID=A0ACC0TVN4_9AGAM|nr:hypothetical protein F5148DRAFT_1379196 [Russula earlei]